MSEYVIDGSLKLNFPGLVKNKLVNLQTFDPKYKFRAVRSYLPFKKPENCFVDLILYSVISFEKLNESNFDQIFEKGKYSKKYFKKQFSVLNFLKGYKVVATLDNTYSAPLYKKVRYSHTPFPQVLIDGVDRSRIVYLKNYEWLIGGSKESTCMSARNIALLISKKELGKNFVHKTSYKPNKLLNLIRNDITSFSFYFLLRITKIFEKFLFRQNE